MIGLLGRLLDIFRTGEAAQFITARRVFAG